MTRFSHAAIRTLDLFAGPGGWDHAAQQLGLDPLGVEWDDAACETRKAAGLRTLQGDVAQMDPDGFGPVDLLIASPPCQAFSVAGDRKGAQDVQHIIRCLHELAAGNDTRPAHKAKCADDRSLLVVEPLRFVVSLKPRWIVLEQVPPVLELWSVYAELLGALGYGTWAGILEAERHGVPQTRERAVLIAEHGAQVAPPAPTHQRYVYGEPAAYEMTFEGELLPWVSMAAALGWGFSERPSMTLTGAKKGPSSVIGGGSGAVDALAREQSAGEWVQRERSGDRSEEGFDPAAMPAQTLTSKARSWTVHRPATTIACDSRVFQPGGHHEQGQQSQNAIRLDPCDAGVLQSFPADYPWRGSRSAQYQQIGNAVPPLMAKAILEALLADVTELEEAA